MRARVGDHRIGRRSPSVLGAVMPAPVARGRAPWPRLPLDARSDHLERGRIADRLGAVFPAWHERPGSQSVNGSRRSSARYTMISGKTRLIAHIGYPTESFKAPMIYNPWFEKRGIDAVVVPMGVKADDYVAAPRGAPQVHEHPRRADHHAAQGVDGGIARRGEHRGQDRRLLQCAVVQARRHACRRHVRRRGLRARPDAQGPGAGRSLVPGRRCRAASVRRSRPRWRRRGRPR